MFKAKPELLKLFEVGEEHREEAEDAVNHGIAVAALAERLAAELGLDRKQCEMIGDAGLLHNIGKLQVADGIEKDITRIEEMKYVRMYPEVGYRFLCENKVGSEEMRQLVHHYHENYDGSGYPDRLEGEEIPLGSRILRVSDVYVALISDRPYRKAFDCDTAMELMIEEVKNFDMHVFLAFMGLSGDDDFAELLEFVEELNRVNRFDYPA